MNPQIPMLVLTRKAKVLSEFGNGAFGQGGGMRFLPCHLRKKHYKGSRSQSVGCEMSQKSYVHFEKERGYYKV